MKISIESHVISVTGLKRSLQFFISMSEMFAHVLLSDHQWLP